MKAVSKLLGTFIFGGPLISSLLPMHPSYLLSDNRYWKVESFSIYTRDTHVVVYTSPNMSGGGFKNKNDCI